MSTTIVRSYQIGIDGATAANNFSLEVPITQDGTLKLGRGNSNSTSSNVFTVDASNNITFSGYVGGTGIAPATGGRLTYTNTTTLTYVPFAGNLLYMNGVNRPIPSAGVTLPITGLSAATTYFVYAYWTGSAIALTANGTGYVLDSMGMPVLSSDATRTLVGQIRTLTGPVFSDTALIRFVISYWNRRNIVVSAAQGVDYGVFSATFAEIGAGAYRGNFLSFGDEAISVLYSGTASNNVANCLYYTSIGLNGTIAGTGFTLTYDTDTGHYRPITVGGAMSPVAGPNYIAAYSQDNLTATTTYTAGNVLSTIIRG